MPAFKTIHLKLPHSQLDMGVAYFNVARTMQSLGFEFEAVENYRNYLSIVTPTWTCWLEYREGSPFCHRYIHSNGGFWSSWMLASRISFLLNLHFDVECSIKKHSIECFKQSFCYQNKTTSALESLFQARGIILSLPESRKLIMLKIRPTSVRYL